jgi:uncharacterized repeat protein (TIGR01451 family)
MRTTLLRLPLLVVMMLVCVLAAPAQNKSASSAVLRSGWDIQHDTSPPLRDIVGGASTGGAGRLLPVQILEPFAGISPQVSTGLSIVQNFPGFAAPGGSIPNVPASDTSGAAGPDHYMQAVNFSATIYDKTGAIVQGPFSTTAFWSTFPFTPCAGGLSDEVVMYDQAAQRWFVSKFARVANPDGTTFTWYQCFAISTTTDPTGAYNRYAFLVDPIEFNDYPKFGIWPDGYYMTADRNKIFPGQGVFALAFERQKMLNNQPAQYFIFKLDNGGVRAGMLPSDWDGDTPPPAGSPNYFVRTLDPNIGWPASALEVWAFQVDWANSTAGFTLRDTLTPDPFDSNLYDDLSTNACTGNQICVPQPGTGQGLDPQAAGRPMFRLAYRNFGDHEALSFNHTVDAADFANHSAIRWYEMRKSNAADPWSIYQQSTFAPDSDHRWMGTMAMDRFGNLAIGYNVSSGSVFPSLRVAGRLAGDPLGGLTEEFTLQAGSGSYTGTSQFADYSQMEPDPLDDCTLWFTGTYQPITSNLYTWATQIGAFRFPDCAADLAVTKTRSPSGLIDAGTDVTYTVTLTNNGPADAGNVTLNDAVPAGTGLVSFSSPPDWTCDAPALGASGPIACTKTRVLNGESAQFTVVVTVKCSTPNATVVNNTATAGLATPVDNDASNDSQSASLTVNNPVPVVTASLGVSLLPQNNHELANVGLSATVTDGPYCPAPALVLQVFGDEDDETPTGVGEVFSPDAKDIAVATLRLRQERMSTGDGRVYLVVAKATDGAGGTGFATATVGVPKSTSAANLASVAAQAAAAKAFADANGGTAPAGYFVIGDGPVVGSKQ